MIEAEIDAILAEILSSVLERPVAAGENVTRESEERWDSLKHIEMVFAVEAAFGTRFTEEEITEIRSVADFKKKALAQHAA